MNTNHGASQSREGKGLSLFVAMVAILVITTGAVVVLGGIDETNATNDAEDFTYTTDTEGATITGLTDQGKSKTTLMIPEKVNIGGTDYNIVTIGDSAFKDKGYTFTSIIIGPNIKSINHSAFEGCANLTGTLVIPSNVTFIGNYVFDGCSNISSVEYNAIEAETHATSPFHTTGSSSTTGLSVIFGDSVVEIPSLLFSGNTKLNSITWGKSITAIGDSAFMGCTDLKGTLTIPDKVTTIGDLAFKGCSGITGPLTIPSKVTKIGDEAFIDCTGIQELTIPGSVVYFGQEAFRGTTGLQKIEFKTLPNPIDDVGAFHFSNANSEDYKFTNIKGDLTLFYRDEVESGFFNDRTFEHNSGRDYIMTYCVISLNADGGECSVSSVKTGDDGKLTEALPIPTRAGYAFGGWYYDDTPVTLTTEFDRNTTVVAKWDPVYTIAFNANFGDCSVKTLITDITGKLTQELPTPTREGFTFDGWYLDGVKITQDTVFTENSTVVALWTAVPEPEPEPEKKNDSDLYWALFAAFVIAILAVIYLVVITRN